MARLKPKLIPDLERIIEFDLVRATEAAALNASQWMGKGDKSAADLASGDDVMFCATGISDSPLLPGVRFEGKTATTHSILMRAKTRTVRHIRAMHDLSTKTIRLRSTQAEKKL